MWFFCKELKLLKNHEYLKHTKNTLTFELYDYMISNVQYLKSHMQALGQADEIYVDSESLV